MIKKMVIAIFIISLAFSMQLNAANLSFPFDEIRVALSTEVPSAELFISEGNYEVVDLLTQLTLGEAAKNSSWLITPLGKGNLQITRDGVPQGKLAGAVLILRPKDPDYLNVFKYQGKRYRDTVFIENINGNLRVINSLNIEKYLKGVVGAEMGSSAPLEALKAQAIVSRTYALYYKENSQIGYDVGINTSWQIYGGYDQELVAGPQVINAITMTKGQVICYNGNLIQAFFHANSGGYTENSENVWWEAIPYLRAVPSPGDLCVLNYSVQESGWPINTYQWTKSFCINDLEKQFALYNRNYPGNQIQVGNLIDLRVSRLAVNPNTSPRGYLSTQTPSSRVTEIEIIGTQGSKMFYRDGIRSVFDLRSSMFEIFFDSTVDILSATQKTLSNTSEKLLALGVNGLVEKINGENSFYYVQDIDGLKTIPKKFSEITFKGKGHGHGLGMSQWGARGLADQGYNYQQIIQHYYNSSNFDGKLTINTYYGQSK